MNVEEDLQTAAWIARQVGVGRAAVANWRKRYPDFPQPAAGGANSPLFSWSAVQAWLVENGKAGQLAATGRTATGTQLIGDAPSVQGVDRDLSDLEPGELLARVLVSLLPRLGDDAPDDDEEPPVVLDPVCRDAAVLTAVVERYGDHVRLAGQAPDDTAADAVRSALAGVGDVVRVGDALRADLFAASRGTARAVLCVPPPGMRQWPAADLAADPRWRYGLPDPADPDLAWVQHCLAHLRSGGLAVVVVSPVTGQRPSGRHVRAALVRAGVLRDVIALPDGLAEGAVLVWVLRHGGQSVRMVDLSGLTPADVPLDHAAWEPVFAADDPAVVRSVPQVELLDGDTPLVPARYLRPAAPLDDLGPVTARLRRLYADLARALPQPAPPRAAGRRADV
ncbi:MAG: SAM-dependent methyltransferase, partial [Pseudonocardia sp.]|nr:SAM-dependent methyltransferase [Pseudonocardia sp.]